MAKQKVVQPGRQAKMPKDYPVNRYPYMAVKPNDDPLKRPHYRTHTEAIQKLRHEVIEFIEQFKHLSTPEMRENAVVVLNDLGKLPRTGGVVERMLDPERNVRYRVELVLRKAA